MSTDEYVPSDGELQELIVGLLLDAGDYVRHGQPDPGETLTWDQREVRAWRAARLLSERHAHDTRFRRDALQQFIEACKAKRDEPGFLLPANYWRDIEAAIRVAESYVKNQPEVTL